MAIRFDERPNSPTTISAPEPAVEREYVCDGVDDGATVMSLALQMIPGAMATPTGIAYRQDIRVRREGVNLHYITASYTKGNRGKWTWDADTTGGQFTIKTSRQHMASYVAAGQVAKNHNGAIGRQPDGTVEGAPVVIPAMKFNISYSHPQGRVTTAFAKYIHSLTGKVNSEQFLDWAPGEVLFLGGRLADGTEAEATAGYSFAMETNLQNALIGGIQVVEKQGHDYAWIEFRNTVLNNQAVTVPRQIDVCRVYERVDLKAALGL